MGFTWVCAEALEERECDFVAASSPAVRSCPGKTGATKVARSKRFGNSATARNLSRSGLRGVQKRPSRYQQNGELSEGVSVEA
jgi:hypothetical protein